MFGLGLLTWPTANFSVTRMSELPTGTPSDGDFTPKHDATSDDATKLGGDTVADGGHSSDIGFAPKRGMTVGPYILREIIGAGGMGEVWKAEQSEPVRRTVALKLIKSGMDSREVLARFEAERQALAMMDHPCIAKVFDAGTSPQGRPYFAMEYVRGVPITDYCDRRRLNTRDRLQLFQRVCEGVQHAHQNAVLHRDLKPGNILVAEVDGKPVPKIIDFGLAKAMTHSLTENTMYTVMGQLLGTPEYMSPEQAEMTGEDVDTRTDVYSLGVVLYELLVGVLPFEPEELRRAGFDGIRKMLCEKEPMRLNARLTTLGGKATSIAQTRRTDLRHLRQSLKGDLDWIVMRSLEKDRNRRYGSPAELAQDIDRHLADEPVLAGPPTRAYRLRKFSRRHRVGISVAAVVLVGLIGFAVTVSFQARSIAHQKDRAEQAAAEAQSTVEFLRNMLSTADPWAKGESDVTVVKALKGATEKLGEEFEGQPLLEARIRALVGSLDLNVGNMPAAKEQTEKALALMTHELGPDDLELAGIWGDLSQIDRMNGDFDEAIHAGKEKSRITQIHFPSPSADVVKAWDQLANAFVRAQRPEEADSVYTLQEDMIRQLGDEHRILLAQVLLNRGALAAHSANTDYAAEDSLSTAALKIYRQYDPDNPHIGIAMNNIGTSLLARGKFEEAKTVLEESMAFIEKTLGPDQPTYASACENLANVEFQTKHNDEAMKLLDKVLDIRRRNLGPDNVNVIRSELNIATVANWTGDHERALKIYDELLPQLRAKRGGDHPDVAGILQNRSSSLQGLGRYDEAEASLEEARAMYERLYGEHSPQVGRCHSLMGQMFFREKRFDDAEKELKMALPILRDKLGDEHVDTKGAARWMVNVLEATGRGDEAGEYRKLAGKK